jgi:thiamine-phosphate pyrophosphorylase
MAFQKRPVICLVSDRRRLHAARGQGCAADGLVALVGAAARAGVDLVHVREGDLPARELTDLVRRCVRACADTGARVVVNDRLDVALAAGAAGVQLRSDGVPADRVRAIAPSGFLIGRSVHSADEGVTVASAGGLDYLVLGTVFPSASKCAGHPVVGIGEVRSLAGRVGLPVLAIGGITRPGIESIWRAGASGVAAISLFIDPPGDGIVETRLGLLIGDLRRAFDSAKRVS